MRRLSFWRRARLPPSDRLLSLVSLEFVPRIPTYFRLLPVFSFSVVGYTRPLLPAHPEIDAPLTPLSLTPSLSEYGAAMLKKGMKNVRKCKLMHK